MSAYAKLRKQRYDKQYRLDLAIFGHSRLYERMREAGRLDEYDNLRQRRDPQSGKFVDGFVSRQQATKDEVSLFLDDLVGVPPSSVFCWVCGNHLSKDSGRLEFPDMCRICNETTFDEEYLDKCLTRNRDRDES
jgi:hypothetical protein